VGGAASRPSPGHLTCCLGSHCRCQNHDQAPAAIEIRAVPSAGQATHTPCHGGQRAHTHPCHGGPRRYATRARAIKNRPTVNSDRRAAELSVLRNENEGLREQIKALQYQVTGLD